LYPFDNLSASKEDKTVTNRNIPNETGGKHSPYEHGKTFFGGQKSTTGGMGSVPRTIGSVFSQEWKDLLKFIAVSKGSTNIPQGLEPMSFRPGNLPPKSNEEQ